MKKLNKLCRLCKKYETVDSHLIPKATYRIIATTSKSNNPILLKGEKNLRTSAQVKSHLLCSKCEGRLSTYGENHVFRYTYRQSGKFKFQDILENLSPEFKTENALVYSGSGIPEIKTEHFVHFAAGVFWKASVGKWFFLKEKLKNNQLGNKYEEQLSRFLIGDCPFPENLVLTMSISNESEPLPIVIFPQYEKRDGYFQHRFYIPGIEFILWAGNLVPKEIKDISISHISGGAFFYEHLDNSPLIRMAKLYLKNNKEQLKKYR